MRAVAMGDPAGGTGGGQRGSALLLTLLVTLGVAAVLQALVAVTICANNSFLDENAGRLRLSERDGGLAWARSELVRSWAPITSTVLPGVGEDAAAINVRVDDIPAAGGWAMRATVWHEPERARLMTSALVERGRDGLDLPVAALVASELTASEERVADWGKHGWAVEPDPVAHDNSAIPCYLKAFPLDPVIGPGVRLHSLSERWVLDAGWVRVIAEGIEAQSNCGTAPPAGGGEGLGPSIAAARGTFLMNGRPGYRIRFPGEATTATYQHPFVIVLMGGADLDARGLGDVFGIVVVQGGSVLLDGTSLHGAVFATDVVDMGESGRVLYTRDVLRYATDQALQRARVMPGTREEGLR